MREVFSLAGAIALLALFHLTGLLVLLELTHPWWASNATLTGGTIGLAMAVLLFWLDNSHPVSANRLILLIMILFPLCLAVTVYFAQKFINAADFEPLAAQIWHKGYIAAVALYMPLAAFVIRPLVSRLQE